MIDELNICLDLDWENIHVLDVEGGPYYKVLDVCRQLSISNTTVAIEKVIYPHKRKFTTGELEVEGESIDVRSWYVTETGLLQMIIQNNTPQTNTIRDRIALRILPRINSLQ